MVGFCEDSCRSIFIAKAQIRNWLISILDCATFALSPEELSRNDAYARSIFEVDCYMLWNWCAISYLFALHLKQLFQRGAF